MMFGILITVCVGSFVYGVVVTVLYWDLGADLGRLEFDYREAIEERDEAWDQLERIKLIMSPRESGDESDEEAE